MFRGICRAPHLLGGGTTLFRKLALKGLANRNALKNMSVFSSWKLKHITECFSSLILDFRVRQLTGGCLECFKFLKLLLLVVEHCNAYMQ